ncbi:MAG: hypothetical protein QMD04_10695 [Anaerolineales bacterium]|nr:hypothetical protein [Anaerolineales bacterium]
MNQLGEKYKYYTDAERVARRYSCATCFGHLNIIRRAGFSEVICARKELGRCAGIGFVTKEYVERARAQSALDRSEAYWNLADTLGLARSKRSAEQIAKELGGE